MRVFIKDGVLTFFSEVLLVALVLLGLFGVPYFNIPLWGAIPIWLVSIISAGLLMFEGRATALGLKPFTKDPLNWRKAKKSYEQDSTPESDDSEKR